jgi:hypothetical protein
MKKEQRPIPTRTTSSMCQRKRNLSIIKDLENSNAFFLRRPAGIMERFAISERLILCESHPFMPNLIC